MAESEIIRVPAGGVGVEFWREADRYRHEITVVTAAAPRVCLSSLEGTADTEWPPSPPLQEFHLEPRPGGKQVALLVGRAGRAHWSLSVEADSSREALLFDVACRSNCEAEHLRSSYCLSDECRWDKGRILFSRYELEAWTSEIHFDAAGGLSIGPRLDIADEGKVRTLRWRYQIRLAAK